MYKVFLNDRLIKIGPPEKITKNKPSVSFGNSCTLEDLKFWFGNFLNNDEKEVFLVHSYPALLFQLFRSAFTELPAAGGVVISEHQLLFIFRNGKWDLPKGKIERGESPREAALREVAEECGISGHQIVKQLPSTFHIYESPYSKKKGSWILKETFWFEMSYSGRNELIPQQEEGITEAKWVKKNALNEVLSNTYENLKQVILLYRD